MNRTYVRYIRRKEVWNTAIGDNDNKKVLNYKKKFKNKKYI